MKKMKCLLLIASLLATLQIANAEDAAASGFTGKVLESTNTAGYTYVLVDTGKQKLWAATTEIAVNVGDAVIVASGVPMPNFHSKSLNRDFDVIYFTAGITVGSGAAAAAAALPPGHPALPGAPAQALPPGHPALTGPATSATIDFTGLKRADGGKTVAEIFAASAKLAGKTILVRGKVVKYNAMILGKNWLHIQDGSGSAGKNDNDLTVTTATPAKVGDTVLVTGPVSTNKDFGAGYKYGVILDDATVTVE